MTGQQVCVAREVSRRRSAMNPVKRKPSVNAEGISPRAQVVASLQVSTWPST